MSYIGKITLFFDHGSISLVNLHFTFYFANTYLCNLRNKFNF